MSSKSWIAIVVGLTAILTAGAALAEDEFTHMYIEKVNETTDLGNGVSAIVAENHGFIIAKDTSHRLHLANQDCYYTSVGTAQAFETAGYCTMVPTSGDGGMWASFQADQTGGTWTVLRSAGSIKGASGSGTFSPGGQWPDGKGYNLLKGTIKMP
jgi:hypothetical protein